MDSSFKEYLFAFINTVLYCRNVYPKSSFKLVNAFNLQIHVTRHPQLAEYLNSFYTELSSNNNLESVEEIQLVLQFASHFEKYVIDVSTFQFGPQHHTDAGPGLALTQQYKANLYSLISSIQRLPHSSASTGASSTTSSAASTASAPVEFDILVKTTALNTTADWVPVAATEHSRGSPSDTRASPLDPRASTASRRDSTASRRVHISPLSVIDGISSHIECGPY